MIKSLSTLLICTWKCECPSLPILLPNRQVKKNWNRSNSIQQIPSKPLSRNWSPTVQPAVTSDRFFRPRASRHRPGARPFANVGAPWYAIPKWEVYGRGGKGQAGDWGSIAPLWKLAVQKRAESAQGSVSKSVSLQEHLCVKRLCVK